MRWITIVHLVPWLLLGCPDTDIEVGPDDDTVADDDDDTTEDPGDDDSSLPLDADGDGWTVEDGDCDDTDPLVHPGATDAPCDALDSDCDGVGAEAAAVAIDGVEYPSFAEAMDIIADGHTLEICPGTHTESIEVGEDRQLTITSYSGDQEDTILDGEGVRQIVRIGLRSEVAFGHLTLRGGHGETVSEGYSCGGAIFTQGRSTVIEECSLVENQAGDEAIWMGGAVCHWPGEDSGPTELLIEGSTFEDNGSPVPRSVGGAVYAYTTDTLSVDIVDSMFTGNTADGAGGAARLGGGPLLLSIHGCRFEDNWTNTGDYGAANGGALEILNWGAVDIADSTFLENTAGDGGGAVEISVVDAPTAAAFVRDCQFEGNRAEGSVGGGLDFSVQRGDVASLYLERTSFDDNEAYSGGGGAHIGHPTAAFVEECSFDGNEAGENGGGALEIDDWDSIEIVDCTFTSNHSRNEGGAVRIGSPAIDGGLIDVQTSLFEGNTCDQDGGALSVDYTSSEAVSLRVLETTFASNSGAASGGALLVSTDGTADLDLSDTDFLDNVAGTAGGAMELSPDALTLDMIRGTVSGNQAASNGGAIKLYPHGYAQHFDAVLTEVVIEDNSVTGGDGGAICFMEDTAVVLNSCTLNRNTGGGVLLWDEADASLSSTNTSWGDGADDNSPWDVAVLDGPSYSSHGPNETFTCSGDVGCQ